MSVTATPSTVPSEVRHTRTPGRADPSRPTTPIRMLFFVREAFPTFRVDVDILFGNELLGRGHQIDFVMQGARESEPAGPRSWRGRTVWVGRTDRRGSFLGRLRRHCLDFAHDLRCLRLVRPDRYQAVQVRDKFLVAIIALVVARRRGLKFFYWLSFPAPESQLLRAREGIARYPRLTMLRALCSRWLLYTWILPRSDHVFVQSERMKTHVAARGIRPDKMTVVPMGIDRSEINVVPLSGKAENVASAVTLGYLGTLNAQRRIGVLVEMLSVLRRRGLCVRLLLVGDADDSRDRLYLERRAAELGVAEQLTITGFVPRAKALALISTVDIAFSPFYPTPVLEMCSPTKLVEYLALGIPVVANDQPEQRLILKQCRAGVCVPWGARHFARAAEWLVRRPPLERQAMGARGARWVLEHRTYGRIADELEAKYLRLLHQP